MTSPPLAINCWIVVYLVVDDLDPTWRRLGARQQRGDWFFFEPFFWQGCGFWSSKCQKSFRTLRDFEMIQVCLVVTWIEAQQCTKKNTFSSKNNGMSIHFQDIQSYLSLKGFLHFLGLSSRGVRVGNSRTPDPRKAVWRPKAYLMNLPTRFSQLRGEVNSFLDPHGSRQQSKCMQMNPWTL